MIATVTLNPSLDEWVTLPYLSIGQLHRASSFERYPGGKGINVSRVIHELGGRTVAFALAGGEDGVILRQLMNRLSIVHNFVTVNGMTRNNYKIRTKSPRALTELNAPGPKVSARDLRELLQRLLRTRPQIDCVVFSGSLPPGAPYTVYAQWIRKIKRRGIITVLDASGEALRYGLSARPWFIKPNKQEAEELLGRSLNSRVELVRAVRELLTLGCEVVVLSLGSGGALMSARACDDVWFAAPPRVRVDSAVGAGDSFVGGFLMGWSARHSLLEAFRLGMACGAASAMTSGTKLCHRADVRRLIRRVALQRIA